MHSRIPTNENSDIDISHPDIRYCSIITPLNVHRDRVNELGCVKFAKDTGQTLQEFHAVDYLRASQSGQPKKKKHNDPAHKSDLLQKEEATKLLSLRPALTGNIPGVLKLCYGLPVMIKKNEAVEANVTNGAEGKVTGFQSHYISETQRVLDVVFVKLINPPSPIQIEGLELNEVPVSMQHNDITATMPNGSSMFLTRQQVPILPNFGMTDFGCQGRTREVNVMDLKTCRNHQSVYTCLSRASTYKGTVIMRMCDIGKITGGITGWQRQEFRELELLDYITKLRFNGELKEGVGGNTRASVINSFKKVYQDHCPSHVPDILKWSAEDSLIPQEDDDEFVWQRAGANHKSEKTTGKRKRMNEEDTIIPKNDIITDAKPPPKKKQRTHHKSDLNDKVRGITWNADTWSCAYDSILTILSSIYFTNVHQWHQDAAPMNRYLSDLTEYWKQVLIQGSFIHLEKSKNYLQSTFHRMDPEAFPMNGKQGTDLIQFVQTLLNSPSHTFKRQRYCKNCSYTHHIDDLKVPFIALSQSKQQEVIGTALKHRLDHVIDKQCPNCRKPLSKKTIPNKDTPPPFIAIKLSDSGPPPKLSLTMSIGTKEDKFSYKLRGICYFGQAHFTSRIISKKGDVWYHDGITTKEKCIHEGQLKDIKDIYVANDRHASILIYSIV
ncbi:hypothetical protein DENSPDRAFT_789969 [Dentipellis sp. KUC8613]|nr:hypothetical protein DENSPDRAFT_789969 [Dentipellis sp. KUC8613]